MGRLNAVANQTTKDPATQFAQIAKFETDCISWSNNIINQDLISYLEPAAGTIESTASNAYIGFNNFTFNPNVNNPLCVMNFILILKGIGSVGVVLNNALVGEIPFQNTGFLPVSYTRFLTLSNGANKINLQWKSSTGTVSKSNNANSNLFQIVSFNS